MNSVCGDNRFEIIAKVKEHLIKATNIEMHPEELAQVDNVLFRLWQLGYFYQSELEKESEEICSKYFEENCYKKNKWADTHDLVAMWQDGYNKANEWNYPSKGEYPKETETLLSDNLILITQMKGTKLRSISLGNYNFSTKEFDYPHIKGITDVIAWKEIVLPKEIKEND